MNSQNIELAIASEHEKLSKHPAYSKLTSLSNVRHFMECHVFAVWDFMSLLKSLQRTITCIKIPWRPSPYPKEIVRMINQIVLGEESDIDENGLATDHFSLYLRAMNEIGADCQGILHFIKNYNFQILPKGVSQFVSFNLDLSMHGEVHEVAAAFFYGREKIIPEMFTSILNVIENNSLECPSLLYYLKRHIQLDGEEHSILARGCLEGLCGNDQNKWNQCLKVAKESLQLRSSLWDTAKDIMEKENLLKAELGNFASAKISS